MSIMVFPFFHITSFEHSFKENLQVYGGFATDYSARKEGTNTNLSITDWDIYNITGGVALSERRFSLTVGLGYAWGHKERTRTPPVLDTQVDFPGFVEDAEFNYRNYKIIFGFAF